MVRRPRGTRDFLPDEMKRRLALERLFDSVGARHGFQRVATPTFESLELFTAKSGQGIVDELYAFDDKGGRPLTLRPELTAPVMRMVAAEMTHVPHPLRLSYFGNCFRYEEFKTGRYREFWQYGCEIVGAEGALVEAEVIAFATSLIDATGLSNWRLSVGHVGILRAVLEAAEVTGEAAGEVMRLIDKGDFDAVGERVAADYAMTLKSLAKLSDSDSAIADARSILSGIGLDCSALDELELTMKYFSALQPDVRVGLDLSVARGLDYYTGVVFEIEVDSLGGEGQILGGGSYRLMHLFDKPDLDPCCGFGAGFDRILLALAKQIEAGGTSVLDTAESGSSRLAIIPFRIDVTEILPLVANLRSSGSDELDVLLELRTRKVQRSIHWAESRGATHILIIGPRDIEAGAARVKRLSDGAENDCSLTSESVITAISNLG
jgi:histidyl-tRNA synthetase